MMKKNLLYIFVGVLVLMTGCNQKTQIMPEEERTLELTLDNDQLRSYIKDPNGEQVLFRWDRGAMDIKIVFKQGDVMAYLGGVQTEAVENGNAICTLTIPSSIDLTRPFDLYGIIADRVKVKDGKILVGIAAHSTYDLLSLSPNRDGDVPVYFQLKDVEARQKKLSATFHHLGAMAVISIKNSSPLPLKTAGFAIVPHEESLAFYHKGALPYVGNTELPYLDLLNPVGQPDMILSNVDYPMVEIPAGGVSHVGFWFVPLSHESSDINLVAYQLPDKVLHSETTLPGRQLKAGQAYAIYAEWNGEKLMILDEEPMRPIPEGLPVATFETAKSAGEQISIGVLPKGVDSEPFVFVDLNGNAQPDKGEYITDFTNDIMANKVMDFKLQNSKFAIYGDVEILQVIDSGVTKADLSKMPNVEVVDFWRNNLTTLDLSSNIHLNTVAIQDNQLSQLIFPSENRIQFLFLESNKLRSLDIKPLSSLTEANIASNLFDSAALNQIYSDLPTAKDLDASWKYHLYVFSNPGVSGANDRLATDKGWTIHADNPQN